MRNSKIILLLLLITYGSVYSLKAQIQSSQCGQGFGVDKELSKSIDKQKVSSLAISGSDFVHQIQLNGVAYGSSDAVSIPGITISDGEYFSSFRVRAGSWVDYLELVTNKGRKLTAGTDGTNTCHIESNVKVLSISGQYDSKHLTQITINYMINYTASKIVDSNAICIIKYTPGKTTTEEYTDISTRKMDMYKSILETYNSIEINASASTDFLAKMSIDTKIDFSEKDTKTAQNELETLQKSGTKTTREIGNDEVSVQLVSGYIMESQDKSHWFYPVGDMSTTIKKNTDFKSFLEVYDLTGGVIATQLSGLSDYQKKKNGYVYFGKK